MILRQSGPAIPVLERAVDHPDAGVGAQDLHLLLECVLKEHVVRVQKQHEFGRGSGQAEIPCGAHPAIRVTGVLEVIDEVAPGVSLRDRRAPIRRAVVNEQ